MAYIIFIIVGILLIIVPLFTVYVCSKRYILAFNDLPVNYDAVVVLGAGIRPDGEPCDLLADRLTIGSMVYLNGNCKTMILSGDNRDYSRNEVLVMKRWILDKYIKDNKLEKYILLDEVGFCTYKTIVNAKWVYNTNSIIICTNKYHLPRAIYIARSIGLKVCGIMSDLREYDRMKHYKKREILACIKDYYVIKIKRIFNKI